MLYIGVELGISEIKSVLMQEDGKVLQTKTEDLPVTRVSEGWIEQNPSDWWTGLVSCIDSLLENHKQYEIDGISFCGQMQGLVILDEDDEVIRPAILSVDMRSKKEADYLNNVIGRDKLVEYTSNVAETSFTATKLMWIKDHEYEKYRRIRKIMLPKDYLVYKLTGQHVTDFSDASATLLFDVNKKRWSVEMLHICEIRQEWLPKVCNSFDCVGNISEDIAIELGINEDCIVATGSSDKVALAISTGTVADGRCIVNLDDQGDIFIASKEYKIDKNVGVNTFAHANGDYYLFGRVDSAISCCDWWMEEVLKSKDSIREQAPLNKMVSQKMIGNNNVFFLPYLKGEKSPYNNSKVKGAFIGLTDSTDRNSMYQAIYEGVSYGIRDCIELVKRMGVKCEHVVLFGKGAKSSLWKQILGNILNLNIDSVEIEEGPAYGAAILATVACEEYESLEYAVEKIVNFRNSIFPDAEIAEKYDELYAKYKELYPALRRIYEVL